jgi:hypothetical protein
VPEENGRHRLGQVVISSSHRHQDISVKTLLPAYRAPALSPLEKKQLWREYTVRQRTRAMVAKR